jgi:hexosaminidase
MRRPRSPPIRSLAPPRRRRGPSSDWGVHPYLYNVDEKTFGFLQDVLTR